VTSLQALDHATGYLAAAAGPRRPATRTDRRAHPRLDAHHRSRRRRAHIRRLSFSWPSRPLRALVAGPAGEAMTCGYAVNEAVDNPAHEWITAVILWTAEKFSVAFPGPLRGAGPRE